MTYEKHAPALVQLVAAAKQSLRLCLRIASTDGCTIFFLRSLLTSTSTSSLPGEARPGEVGVRQMRFAVCLPEGGLLFDGRGSTANALRCLPTGRVVLTDGKPASPLPTGFRIVIIKNSYKTFLSCKNFIFNYFLFLFYRYILNIIRIIYSI